MIKHEKTEQQLFRATYKIKVDEKKQIGIGTGTSKKKAKENAALDLCIKLGLNF